MKRYRPFIALLLVLAAAFMLAGCGASAKETAAASADYVIAEPAAAPMMENGWAEEEMAVGAPSAMLAGGVKAEAYSAPEAEITDMSEKIIYTADVTLETTTFDDALEAIEALVKELGGYMESTSVYGNNYYNISRGNRGGRGAYFAIRIPSAHFTDLTGRLSELGNVPSCSTRSNNITQEYYDVQSRLNAYRVQETRLLEMLAIAETVEDMLSIQQQLTNVQYELDSLTGQLRYYDNKVSYSTVNLNVEEVIEYTPEPTVKLGYGEKMLRNLKNSLKNIGRFFSDLGLWLVSAFPVLIVLAAVALIIFFPVRRAIRRRKERKAKPAEEKEDK